MTAEEIKDIEDRANSGYEFFVDRCNVAREDVLALLEYVKELQHKDA